MGRHWFTESSCAGWHRDPPRRNPHRRWIFPQAKPTARKARAQPHDRRAVGRFWTAAEIRAVPGAGGGDGQRPGGNVQVPRRTFRSRWRRVYERSRHLPRATLLQWDPQGGVQGLFLERWEDRRSSSSSITTAASAVPAAAEAKEQENQTPRRSLLAPSPPLYGHRNTKPDVSRGREHVPLRVDGVPAAAVSGHVCREEVRRLRRPQTLAERAWHRGGRHENDKKAEGCEKRNEDARDVLETLR